MKNYFIFLTIFIAIISAISAETVTEELLRAQDELNHSNLFVEHYLFRHRDAVTTLLAQLQLFSKDIFMDTYTEIKHLARDTEHIIRENEPSACRDRIERRFDLQVMRFGQRLSGCLAVATQIIKSEYSDLNFYHTDGQRLTVHTPNQSLNIISQTDIFEGKFHFLINQRLRQLLSRAAPWILIMDDLYELMDGHMAHAINMITVCHENVHQAFIIEVNDDLERLANC